VYACCRHRSPVRYFNRAPRKKRENPARIKRFVASYFGSSSTNVLRTYDGIRKKNGRDRVRLYFEFNRRADIVRVLFVFRSKCIIFSRNRTLQVRRKHILTLVNASFFYARDFKHKAYNQYIYICPLVSFKTKTKYFISDYAFAH